MTRRRFPLARYLAILLGVALGFLYLWMIEHHPEVGLAVLRHGSFVVWTLFVFWFGFGRKWEETAYGVNTLIVSAAIWLALVLVEVSIWWPTAEWRVYLQYPVWSLILAGGIQRLSFLLTEKPEIAHNRENE